MTRALFTGACRSGKSSLAQHWVEERGNPCIYLATAGRLDDPEMDARIAAHQAARGDRWQTLELCAGHEPGDLCAALDHAALLAGSGGAVLLDCTTLWLAGLLETHDDAAVLAEIETLANTLTRLRPPVALVHNEVGWGLVPDNPLGRRFRDLSGLCGQRLASVCDIVVLAVCGLPLALKGSFPG